MTKKGFSLIELLVTVVITGVVLSAVYAAYISLYSGSKQLSKISESNLENIMSSEMIRADLSNAGLGLGSDEKDSHGDLIYPVWWDNGTLEIFTTYDRSDPKTYGWVLFKCEESGSTCEQVSGGDNREESHYSGLKLIDGLTSKIINYSSGTVSSGDHRVAIGYPYDTSKSEKFLSVSYYMADSCGGDGKSDKGSRCADNSTVLCRDGKPIVDCAAGFQVYAGYEEEGDITYDILSNIVKKQPDSLKKLRRLVVFALVQEGQYDKNFLFGGKDITMDLGFDLINDPMDQITFNIPENGEHYRWNILSIDSRTFNVGEKYDKQ